MNDAVRDHYESHPYPRIPLLAAIRPWDTYALNLTALWARCNGRLLAAFRQRILLAGCGTFSPYPFSIANPGARITALDLSSATLQRARLHARVHGCRDVDFVRGDLTEPAVAPGPFHLIDVYGVLHHLADPASGLAALAGRLAPGGILRLMVYSHGARREVEAVRRAFRLLGIDDPATARHLVRRAPKGSRLARVVAELPEAGSVAGFADAFLHPRARTYRIDQLMELLEGAGLTPLLFTHSKASPDVAAEVERLRRAEREGAIGHNYTLLAGKEPRGAAPSVAGSRLLLNPALQRAVSGFRLLPLRIDGRLGSANPCLDRAARRFLRRFREPVAVERLTGAELALAKRYCDALFLFCVDGDEPEKGM
ncbi:MAG: methyltransferase domain-containing protein [Geobacter sp.]|nr:methyltransferase domain-containing protein [Geobacter sp.]